ncbi:MAG TPA: hypothetical protein DEG47_05315, partial [Cyanobacteria bacterium UBA11148]|nr:hypothetical protein [Cyanobacteria bacterium UBA11148]
NKDIFEIITYDDLPWGEDYDYLNNYSQERKTWQYELNNEIRDPQKIYVLLQHDVDSIAERTLAILREEERLGIRSNIMIFNRRINRQHLEKTGNLLYTPYELDYDYLIRLQDQYGFVIGYHCNAYERALFDREKALEIFEEDVSALRQHFNIRYFSPHGGPRSSEGLSNNSLEIPDSLRYSLRWVANKRTVRFDRSYSDGGLNSLSRNPADRDLRDFVRMWQRGKRYRVLVHPQYYHSPCEHSPRLAGTPWYEEVLSCYSSSQLATAWNNVHWELKTFKNNLSEFEQSKTTLI